MKRIITWFINNPVAANLLMLILVFGGLLAIPGIHKEEFPNVKTDVVQIRVPYLGAAPEEVEESVCVRIEEAIESIEGIKKINTSAMEGLCSVSAELSPDADKIKALDDINAGVDSIDTFPVETEKPIVTEITIMTTVLEVAVSGYTEERSLKELAERARDDLTDLPEVSQVQLFYTRPYEISVEVSEQTLRQYGLTLEQVADTISASSVDVPGGSVKTSRGEILLRTKGQLYRSEEFESVVVISRTDGTVVTLGEIAEVIDGFEDTDLKARFDGQPAVLLRVSRVGDEDTLKIARVVKAYIANLQQQLPEGISLTVWRDESQDLVDRLDVLLRNAAGGLALVLLTLTLFLRFRLALWVAAGIPIAILGAIMLFPLAGVSISSLSVMGFILALGILVDDAIVVGERIYAHEIRAEDRRTAAVHGTEEVSTPVIFGVLTTMAAFIPIMNLSGNMGSFFAVVGITVSLCLLFSVIESQLILPVHLAHRHVSERPRSRFVKRWLVLQDYLSKALEDLAYNRYRPIMLRALEWRYSILSIGVAIMVVVGAMIGSGRIIFQFFPAVEGDRLYAVLSMPEGTAVETTEAAVRRIEVAAERLRSELDANMPPENPSNIRHILSSIGTQLGKGSLSRGGEQGSHIAEVGLELVPYRERGGITPANAAALWREFAGSIPDVVELNFTATAFSFGKAIAIQLRGRDVEQLGLAAAELREELAGYRGVFDISDTFRSGKQELKLQIRPEAELLGLSQSDLGSQVRQAFYGEEAQRLQRGRDDVRVMVRFPEAERRSLGDLENMRIRTADGTEVPALSVAETTLGRGYATIKRVDGQRVVRVLADVDRNINSPEAILLSVSNKVMPAILARYPGIEFSLTGEAEERAEAMGGLVRSGILALLVIYALLAIPLRSYFQPLVIMSSIPFGMIGAVIGHYILGMDLVFFSLLGIVALSGVVVNASLVLVDYINRQRRRGVTLIKAVNEAGAVRFRPILLTSTTTFVGLLPLIATANIATGIFVPMAVSLAFGVVFATSITLFLVPALYVILEDARSLIRRLFMRQSATEQLAAAARVIPGTPPEETLR